MTATVFYDDANEIALLTNTFLNASGTATDPTTVSCTVTDPSGAATTHTYSGAAPADIVRVSAGKYTLSVPCSPAVAGVDGLWGGKWTGTGAVSDVQPVTWRVLPANTSQLWYIGLEEFKDRIGITDASDDYAAQTAIQASAGWINEYCGRHFYRITETRTFMPYDIYELMIDDLVSVTSLSVDFDGDGTFEQSWVQGTDYQLKFGKDRYNLNSLGIARPYNKVQVVNSGKTFPFIWPFSHYDRVQINGTWGWPAVPPPVAEANRILAADEFKMKDAPFGVAGVSDYGVVKITSNPWLVENLRAYVNPKRKVGV